MSPSSSQVRTPGFHPGNRGSNPLGDIFSLIFVCQEVFFYSSVFLLGGSFCQILDFFGLEIAWNCAISSFLVFIVVFCIWLKCAFLTVFWGVSRSIGFVSLSFGRVAGDG